MKVRIVERTSPCGNKRYVIQQKHWLFRWWWVDAGCNYVAWVIDSFSTLEEAEENLCHFDGTKIVDRVVE